MAISSNRRLAVNLLTFLGVVVLARDWYEVMQRRVYKKMVDLKPKPVDESEKVCRDENDSVLSIKHLQ